MNINFFEEYPTEENLKIVATLTWPATIFLAANSFAEYKKNEKIVKNLNPIIETAFWPILEKSYWVSPFSDIKDLEKLENDILLTEKGTTVLLDLELPLFKKGSLYYKNFFNFIKNKRKIKKILKIANEKGVQIVTAEYPRYFFGFDLFYKILGLSFSVKKFNHFQCVMFYSSMIKNKLLNYFIKRDIVKKSKNNKDLQIGLGVIDVGVFGDEPLLDSSSLVKDLLFIQENKIKTVVIFRIGGLNNDYLEKIYYFKQEV